MYIIIIIIILKIIQQREMSVGKEDFIRSFILKRSSLRKNPTDFIFNLPIMHQSDEIYIPMQLLLLLLPFS
jgi:hypothetical protein